MLPQHHLLQLTPLRVDSAIGRVQGLIWTNPLSLPVRATEAGPEFLPFREARSRPLKPVRPGTAWGRLFDQRWCRVQLPRPSCEGDWFSWKDQGEGTLYIDGKPYFGFDVAHSHCRLPAGKKELWVEANCVQSAIWHVAAQGLSPEGSRFDGAFLMGRNEEAWKAFHDLKCLFDFALNLRQQEDPKLLPQHVNPGCVQPSVQNHSPLFRRLLRFLERAVDALDQHGPAAASRELQDAYAELRNQNPLLRCTLTGHAHIDLVWLWPERIGEIKAVHTFSTANRLMEEYPEYRFAYSQPASYEAVRRRSPALYEAVQKRIRQKKWQATGTMYVESDTLLACGEALLRSFLVGQKCFREISGKASTVTWLPDVFGYSACLPQMMRLAGVNSFFTTKMTWSMVNRFPYSSFIWRGNDGSEVQAHVTQDCGYNTSVELSEIKASSWGHQQSDVHPEYLLPTGFGDGGGGPTAEMCEKAKRFDALPGMPGLEWGHPEEFFARLEKNAGELPVYEGECYLEGHRGTYTTHGNLKAAFRGLERALQIGEAVSAATGRNWPRDHSWKRLIFSQFHDYIPGSSVWDVYAEGVPELQKLAEEEEERCRKALQRSPGKESAFNPHAVAVKRWVKSKDFKREVFVRLEPLSGKPLAEALADPGEKAGLQGMTAANGLAEFRLNRQGWIDRLVLRGKNIPLAGPAGQLMTFCDQPARFEAWDLDRHVLSSGKVCAESPEILPYAEKGRRAGFRVRRKVGKESFAEVRFYLEAGSPLLHVELELDWKETHALLKLLLPTQHRSPRARFGIPYGSLARPQAVNGPQAEAMWEVPFSRWFALSDEAEQDGLFVVTENKYGTSVRDGVVGLSLLRSPLQVGYDSRRGAWPPHLSRIQAPSPFTDQGRHSIRLALGHYHAALPREEHPASLADTLFTPPLLYRGAALSSPLAGFSGLETAIPAWCQPLDKGSWLLRLHETGGQRGTLQIRANPGWKWASASVDGQAQEAFKTRAAIACSPHQILSLVFRPEPAR